LDTVRRYKRAEVCWLWSLVLCGGFCLLKLVDLEGFKDAASSSPRKCAAL
jgi:hypothetical protein